MENLLFGLLTEDKMASQQNMNLFADWHNNNYALYKPEQEVKKENALIYTGFSSYRNAERFLHYERKKGIEYCELKGYNLYAIAESVEKQNMFEDITVRKILDLVERGMIDVVVLTSLNGFTRNQQDTFRLLDKLHEFGVHAEVIGYGSLDKAIFDLYIEESKKQEQKFQSMLAAFVSQCESSERGR